MFCEILTTFNFLYKLTKCIYEVIWIEHIMNWYEYPEIFLWYKTYPYYIKKKIYILYKL